MTHDALRGGGHVGSSVSSAGYADADYESRPQAPPFAAFDASGATWPSA